MSTTPPPLDPTSPPVSSRQRLLDQLQHGWGKAAPDQGEGEHHRMVPRCFPLPSSSSKRTSPLQPVCQVELKKLKLFPSMDINSNRVPSQGIFSLYKDVGGGEGSYQCWEDMSSSRSPVVTSTPTTIQRAVSQGPVSFKKQTALASMDVTRRGGGGHVFDRIALSPVDAEQALVSSGHCAVIHRLEVGELVKKSEDNVDRLLKKMQEKMYKLKESSKHGLVHWGGAKQLEWICLGEVENQQVEERIDWRDWMVEGVGSRTRGTGVRGRFGFGEKKEEKPSYRDELGSVYDFDDGDKAVLTRTKNIQNSVFNYIEDNDDDDFIDDDDDEEWSQKSKKKGKGRGKGKRSGKDGKKPGPVKTPSVDEYFEIVEKVPSIKDLHISQQGFSSLDDDYGLQTPAGSSTNRVVGTTRDYSRAVMEMRGTCPMCSKEMGMAVLQKHAAACQG